GIVQAITLERADGEVLQKNVGVVREIANDLLALGRAQVDRDRLLAAIAGEVIGALTRAVLLDERLETAGLVAAIGLLDLDHGGAELGQDHAGEWARQHAREIE